MPGFEGCKPLAALRAIEGDGVGDGVLWPPACGPVRSQRRAGVPESFFMMGLGAVGACTIHPLGEGLP